MGESRGDEGWADRLTHKPHTGHWAALASPAEGPPSSFLCPQWVWEMVCELVKLAHRASVLQEQPEGFPCNVQDSHL